MTTKASTPRPDRDRAPRGGSRSGAHSGAREIGALLPDRAAEDDPRSWGDERGEDDDARFLDELPPHHRG